MNLNFQQLNILWIALIAGVVLFGGVVWGLQGQFDQVFRIEGMSRYLFLLLLVAAYYGGNAWASRRFEAQQHADLSAKFATFRVAFMVRMFLLEAVAMVSLLFFLLSGNLHLLLYAALSFAFMVLQRPTKSKFENELSVTNEERDALYR